VNRHRAMDQLLVLSSDHAGPDVGVHSGSIPAWLDGPHVRAIALVIAATADPECDKCRYPQTNAERLVVRRPVPPERARVLPGIQRGLWTD